MINDLHITLFPRLREALRIPSPTHAGAMFQRHAQYFRRLCRQHEATNFNLVQEHFIGSLAIQS